MIEPGGAKSQRLADLVFQKQLLPQQSLTFHLPRLNHLGNSSKGMDSPEIHFLPSTPKQDDVIFPLNHHALPSSCLSLTPPPQVQICHCLHVCGSYR